MRRSVSTALYAGLAALALIPAAQAREFYIGGPVHENHMEIVANYLVGVTMAPAMPGMPTGDDIVHLEADVHAMMDNAYGFPDGAWMPYLTISYVLAKDGSDWTSKGNLMPMTATDGPHYANNVKMDGPGKYKLTYRFTAPEANGFMHHTDKESGVPGWWKPFSEDFTFDYPQK